MFNNQTKDKRAVARLRWLAVVAAGTVLASAAFIVGGCQSDSKGGAAASASDPLAGVFGPAPKKSGTELWAENCGRCHNVRSPSSYSGNQWAVIMQHMRMRANLTGEEERTILTLLQAGSGAPD
jgi:hypothetical protein